MAEINILCQDVFPWISKHAIRLGQERQDNRFAQLGGELFILSQQIQLSRRIDSKLVKVAELVNTSCSMPTTKGVRNHGLFDALWRISECKDSNTPAEEILINEIRRSLPHFVQENPEYPSLLRFIADCLHTTELPDGLPIPDEQVHLNNKDTRYPAQVNDTLYTQLRMYSTCSCSTQHLEYARLRLDPEHGMQDDADIPFDLLFSAGAASCRTTNCHSRWKEAKVFVARRNELSRNSRVSFAPQSASQSPRTRRKLRSPSRARKVELGEFCRLIASEKYQAIHFHIHNNEMKLTDTTQGAIWRNFLPQPSVPLADWLEQTLNLSNRVKVTLAYTIARSVWQYYDSYWMTKPWTHENIQIMKETISDRNQIRPHPYFTTKLHKCKDQKVDYCYADDLFHLYPGILALGVVLVEIATKQPFRPGRPHYIWDETTINEYYEWAWTTANCSKLGSTIGAAYESVVNNCLDSELFRHGSINPSKSDKDLQTRQSLLYEKVVLPLQELYHAYKDDWEIQDISSLASLSLGSIYIDQTQREEAENLKMTATTQTFPDIPTLQSDPPSAMPNLIDYNVGWICAINTEYVAAQVCLDERYNRPGDFPPHTKNDYTLGRIGKHNVVISVLPMGEYGISSAARVAEEMTHSFPNIRIRLMVGIGGGVPSSKNDIRLGDVVVSIPSNGQAGVLQYDFGKSIQGQSFQTTGRLDQPPTALRSAVGGLVAQYESKGHQLQNTVENALKKTPRLQKRYGRPDPASDRLYRSHILHPPDGGSCALECGDDPSRIVTRRPRTKADDDPAIHYGLIASGNQLMKDALIRDKLGVQDDILCFEMEAAGLMNNFPCLVIRGICDYADSHKNKTWQGYAAMVAAAYAKDLLYRIVSQ